VTDDCMPMELSFFESTRKWFSAFMLIVVPKVPVPGLVVEVIGRVMRLLSRCAEDMAVFVLLPAKTA